MGEPVLLLCRGLTFLGLMMDVSSGKKERGSTLLSLTTEEMSRGSWRIIQPHIYWSLINLTGRQVLFKSGYGELNLNKLFTRYVTNAQRISPDGKRSDKRGNFQLLQNGNAFVGWSDNGYMSEHSPGGRVLMEAQFASKRFVTYRSYKFNFTGRPAELPALRGFVYEDAQTNDLWLVVLFPQSKN